ncbi:MAG: sialidase family protein [Planctomycetota bacterium]|jgi:hypothetical protein
MKKILFPLAAAALAAPGFAQNPRTPQQLDVGLGDGQAPAIATEGELTAAVWKDNVTEQMYASVSTDQGLTWSAAVRIDDSPAGNKFAEDFGTVISGGNIYVTYRDERNSFDDDLYFTVSTDGGLTWSADTELDKGFLSGGNPVRDWRFAADGDNIVVAITPDNGNEDLVVTYSTDAGTTWSAAIGATSHNGHSDADGLDIVLTGSTALLAWVDNFDVVAGTGSRTADACYLSTFDLTTGTFTSMDVALNPNLEALTGDLDGDISLSTNGSTVAVVMQSDLPASGNLHQTRVNVSTDGGATWGGDNVIGNYTDSVDDCDNSKALVSDSGDVHVIWEDNRSGSDGIYSAMSTDGGVTFTEAAASHGAGGFPEIKGNGDYIGINWTGTSFPEGSQLAISRDGGATYGAPVDAAVGQLGDADFAEVAFNSLYGNFHCIWLSDDTGINQAYVGGMRSQTLTLNGPYSAGLAFSFDGSGFGASETGNEFMVVLSTATGNVAIPGDGRSTGLGLSGVLSASAGAPFLKGTILADGTASVPGTLFPSALPIGTTMHAIGLSRSLPSVFSVTDLVSDDVQ